MSINLYATVNFIFLSYKKNVLLNQITNTFYRTFCALPLHLSVLVLFSFLWPIWNSLINLSELDKGCIIWVVHARWLWCESWIYRFRTNKIIFLCGRTNVKSESTWCFRISCNIELKDMNLLSVTKRLKTINSQVLSLEWSWAVLSLTHS